MQYFANGVAYRPACRRIAGHQLGAIELSPYGDQRSPLGLEAHATGG